MLICLTVRGVAYVFDAAVLQALINHARAASAAACLGMPAKLVTR